MMIEFEKMYPRAEKVTLDQVQEGDMVAVMNRGGERDEYESLSVFRADEVRPASGINGYIVSECGRQVFPGSAEVYRLPPELPTRRGAMIVDITTSTGRTYESGVCHGDGSWYIVGECSGPVRDGQIRSFTVVRP